MLVTFKYPELFQGHTGWIEMSDLPRLGDRVVFSKWDNSSRAEEIFQVESIEWYPEGATAHPDDTVPAAYVMTRKLR